MDLQEKVAIVRAALNANMDRPELMEEDSEDLLDGYVLGFEQAARLVARHLGVDAADAGLQ